MNNNNIILNKYNFTRIMFILTISWQRSLATFRLPWSSWSCRCSRWLSLAMANGNGMHDLGDGDGMAMQSHGNGNRMGMGMEMERMGMEMESEW